MVSAVIFDMDGVLIDSEPFWRKADIEVFATVGVKLTEEMCLQTMGMTCIESVKYWYRQFPWNSKSIEQVRDEIEEHLVRSVRKHGKPLKGVDQILTFFENKNIPIALASSSSEHIIEAVLERLNLAHRFQMYHSAQHEEFGKPHPAVFLTTAERLEVEPHDCIVFEDSINGVKAGLAAGMKVVAVPEAHMKNDKRYGAAHLIIDGLHTFDEKKLALLDNIDTSKELF